MTFLGAARLVFGVLFIVVTFLTLTPNPEDAETGFAFARWLAALVFGDSGLGDKVAHFLAYAVLGASAAVARIEVAGRGRLVVAGLALYGALLEFGQGLIASRSPEFADALANALGAVAGYPPGAIVLAAIFKAVRS